MATIISETNIITNPQIVADDERGIIEKLAEGSYQGVLRITSKAGSVRANHYHKRDSHICYLVSGKIEYLHRPALNENAPLQREIIEPGQLFYTPPMIAHAMHFLEDSEFYCFTTQSREQEVYEDDVVRVILFAPK